jgi:hypothetical protein
MGTLAAHSYLAVFMTPDNVALTVPRMTFQLPLQGCSKFFIFLIKKQIYTVFEWFLWLFLLRNVRKGPVCDGKHQTLEINVVYLCIPVYSWLKMQAKTLQRHPYVFKICFPRV